MMRSLFTAATGMDAEQLRMDLIANNLANVNTTGFKKVRAEFEDLIAEHLQVATAPRPNGGNAPTALSVGLGVRTAATFKTFSMGDMQGTQNPLDVAIEGPGFFQIRRSDGVLAYTRAGNFRLDATGRLTTANGEVVEPAITVPQNALSISIQPDGKVVARLPNSQEQQDLGNIELSMFTNPAGLESMGKNLFLPTPASGLPIRSTPGELGVGALAQGYLESSNVKAVEEMVDMISTQRAYELNSKVIQTADQMLQRLTSLR